MRARHRIPKKCAEKIMIIIQLMILKKSNLILFSFRDLKFVFKFPSYAFSDAIVQQRQSCSNTQNENNNKRSEHKYLYNRFVLSNLIYCAQ